VQQHALEKLGEARGEARARLVPRAKVKNAAASAQSKLKLSRRSG
jgi:hypothetical protein